MVTVIALISPPALPTGLAIGALTRVASDNFVPDMAEDAKLPLELAEEHDADTLWLLLKLLMHDLLDATVAAAATTSLVEGTVTLPTGTDIVIPAMMYIYCFFLSFLHRPARKHNHNHTHTHTHTKFGFQKNQESRKQKKLDIGSCTHRQWHSIRTADETMAVQRKRRRRRRRRKRKAVETLQWQEQSSSDRAEHRLR